MKKGIFAILLVMVLVLTTMTACVKSDAQTETSDTTVSPVVTEPSFTTYEEELFLTESLVRPVIEEMDATEIINYISEVLRISETRTLRDYEMDSIGYNLYHLWKFNTTQYNGDEFETQIYEIFCNVATQAENQGISLDGFCSWPQLPITEVLCEYFSSSSFTSYKSMDCSALESLSEEDVLKVSEVFFKNPVFAYNTAFACDVISTTSCDEAIEMAWQHIETLSKSSATELAENTYWICNPIFMNKNLYDTNKIFEVCKNILANSSYDFVDKYTSILCASFYCSINGKDVADKVFNFVFEDLLKLAQSADQDTYNQIADVITTLYDEYYFLDSQEIADLHEKYDVKLLKKYLTNWKESINAQYSSNY